MQTESDIKIIPIVHGEILPFIFAAAAFGAAAVPAIAGVTILSVSLGSVLTSIGVSFLIDGVTSLFAPDSNPSNVNRQEDPQDPSYVFTGLLNNSKQGVPINIVYGETLIGSTVVSSSIDSFQATVETGGV